MYEVEVLYNPNSFPRFSPVCLRDWGELNDREPVERSSLMRVYVCSTWPVAELLARASHLRKHVSVIDVTIRWMPWDWMWELSQWMAEHPPLNGLWLNRLIAAMSPRDEET